MATVPTYQIEILDLNLNKIAEVKNPFPLNKNGDILRYSKELSDYGQCTFRVSAFDQILTQYGDIFVPNHYHVRIRRNTTIVWQGAIIENSKRTKDFIEIVAAEYLFYLNKVLVSRSSTDPSTGTKDGIFRIFNSGTMSAAVTAVINETVATLKTANNSNSILANMTLGTIENPNYPPNMTDNLGNHITGAWNFVAAGVANGITLTYDFQTVLYVLKSFGVYSYADFYIDNNLVFNFKKFVGNNLHYDVNFTFNKKSGAYPSVGNIIDYNLPRFGQRMVNDIFGIATDTNGNVLHQEQTDQASISAYGLAQGVAAYADVKDQGTLNARVAAELPLVSSPTENNVVLSLNETAAYPIGVWGVGDIVTVNIQNAGVSFRQPMRIVGATVIVNGTGREMTTVQTNIPLPFQFGTS